MAPKDVFISHCGPDSKRDFSVFLARELETRTFTCFFDERSLEAGDDALSIMDKELEAAGVVILVLSKHFFSSKSCMRELHQCKLLGKPVIPLFFGISPDDCQLEWMAREMEDAIWSQFVGGRSGWEKDVAWITGVTGHRLEAVDGFWDICIERTIKDVARLLGSQP